MAKTLTSWSTWSALLMNTTILSIPTCLASSKCSLVCGICPSVAATTRIAPSICWKKWKFNLNWNVGKYKITNRSAWNHILDVISMSRTICVSVRSFFRGVSYVSCVDCDASGFFLRCFINLIIWYEISQSVCNRLINWSLRKVERFYLFLELSLLQQSKLFFHDQHVLKIDQDFYLLIEKYNYLYLIYLSFLHCNFLLRLIVPASKKTIVTSSMFDDFESVGFWCMIFAVNYHLRVNSTIYSS